MFNHTGRSATVMEAKTAKVISTIPLGGSPEFAVADSAAGRVYSNLEDKNEVGSIDMAKHEVVAHWPLARGEQPTGIALDAAQHRLFVTRHNQMMEVLDTTTGTDLSTVPIDAEGDARACDDESKRALPST